jgi:hypothetical protein
MHSKWTSRKFWMAVAAFLGSIGTSIAGLATENKWVVTVGIICSVISTAIYQVCESIVDAAHKNDTNNEN